MKGVLVAVVTAGTLAAVAACSSGGTSQSVNASPRTVTATVTQQVPPPPSTTTRAPSTAKPPSSKPPAPTVTVTAAPPPARTAPAPAPATPMTNAAAVVQQYYQDITDHNYAAAWALGGRNIAGRSYGQYVAGFATTAAISLGTISEFGASQVQAVLYATQTDGTVKVYEGTYTVRDGVLVGASIRQVR